MLLANCVSTFTYAGPGAHGPSGEHLDIPIATQTSTLMRLADGSVNIPKLAQRRMAIRTMIGEEDEHPLTLELNGRVVIDPNAGGRVQAPFTGRIESNKRSLPLIGQAVKKGQVLFYVRPTGEALERGNQQAQLADIRANRLLVEQRIKRLELLDGVVPQKEIEAAQAELSSLIGRQRALSSSLTHQEAIIAPASGVIAFANVLNGQIVEARDLLLEIIDPKHLLIEALTADVRIVNRVEQASLLGLPEVSLSFLGGGRSLREGAIPLNFRAQTQESVLAIAQPVTVIVKLSDKVEGIALPASALVKNPANEPIVWVKTSAERFMAQVVEYKPLDASTIVITKGLTSDNRVVISGAALINQIR